MLSAALGCSHGRVWPPVRPEALFFVLRPSPTWRPRLTQWGRGLRACFPFFPAFAAKGCHSYYHSYYHSYFCRACSLMTGSASIIKSRE